MNNSRTFAAVLSGLTLLTVSALAQTGSSSSGSGNTSGTSSTRTTTTTPASSSSSSSVTTPSSTTGSSTTSGSMNSSTSGSLNSTNASVNADTNANSNSFGPGASQFKSLDTDSDGRISRAEFTASGSAAASIESSSTDTTATATAEAPKGEKKHWWSRRSDKTADSDSSDTFAKLDTDNDGFLSQSELASANAKLKK